MRTVIAPRLKGSVRILAERIVFAVLRQLPLVAASDRECATTFHCWVCAPAAAMAACSELRPLSRREAPILWSTLTRRVCIPGHGSGPWTSIRE